MNCSIKILVVTSFLNFCVLNNISLVRADTGDSATSVWKTGDRHQVGDALTLAGSLRSRFEVKRDFKFDDNAAGNNDDYLLNQVRLNLKWIPDNAYTFFIEGQAADIQGEDAVDEEAKPNIFADELDLHQAYGEVKLDLAGVQSTLKIGRQKFNFGDQRIIGAFEWSNTARVFDAVALTIGNSADRSVQLFSSRAVGVRPDDFNSWSPLNNRYADSTLHGAYYTDKKTLDAGTLEGYYLYRDSSDFHDQISTIGTHLIAKNDLLDFNSEFAYQFGDFGGLTHSAMAVHVEVGATVCQEHQLRIATAYSYGSGDDDATDSRHETFDNLYPTNHLFYGYMDLFSLQNMHNLEFVAQGKLTGDLESRLAYQNFWLAEEDSDAWYNAGLGTVRSASTDVSSYVGSEIDITFRYPFLNKRFWLEASFGHFFAGTYVQDTGPSKDADFFYLMGKFEI